MSQFGPQIAADVLAACKNGSVEAAQAIGRCLGGEYTLSPGEPAVFDPAALPPELVGAGLVLAVDVGEGTAAIVLSEGSGLLPSWYTSPDATGKSKLATLAQELGMLLLPEAFLPLDFQAGPVRDLPASLARGGITAGAGLVSLALVSGGKQAEMFVIWPASSAKALLAESAPPAAASEAKSADASPPAANGAPTGPRFRDLNEGLAALPGYGRSLLRIKVPITVTLAAARLPIHRITELGPGSIIQFEKACTEPLKLEVGGQSVAVGEAVKVGEKFGLRVTSIVMPDERFLAIRSSQDR